MHEVATQLSTILVTAFGTLVAAAVPLLIAWLKARVAAEDQKVRAAVLYVEALTSQAQNLSSDEKKALAIKMINSAPTHSQQAALGKKIEEKLHQVSAELERITKPD